MNCYCFHLTSHVQTFLLPEIIKNVYNFKINKIKYKTSAINQKIMHIKIKGFDNCIAMHPGGIIKYTHLTILPSEINTMVDYEAPANFDIGLKQFNSTNINSLTFSFLIDYNPALDFISINNPLIIEIISK